jgi:8-oxo-dGTP diphosphatase
MAHTRLQSQLEYTPIAFELLPTQFTLADVHHVYQQILGEALDFATFQRTLQAAGVLIAANDQSQSHFHIDPSLNDGQFVFRWRDARQPIA